MSPHLNRDCWWSGDGPLVDPVAERPEWYPGHPHDYRWVCGHLDGLPLEERETVVRQYGSIFERMGRAPANAWLREIQSR